MKIACMVYDRPNYCGGPTVNARRLLPELQRRGHQIFPLIASQGREAPSFHYFRELGMHVFQRQRTGTTVHDQIRWILETVNAVSPDVFLAMSSVAGGYAGRWIRDAGVPTVSSHVSDDDFNWGIARRFACGSPEWAASGLFCISRQLTRRTLELGPHSLVATIPHGTIVPDHAVNQLDAKLTLVFAGRIEERQKRISQVYAAISKAVRGHENLNAKFIGDGSRLDFLKRRTKAEGLESRVQWVGHRDHHQVIPEMQTGHILVLLSDYEGLPGAVIDAMASGLVPVCLKCPGGLDELILDRQTGLWVDDRQESFQRVLDELIDDPELRCRVGQSARDHIRSRYSNEIAADLWERFLSELQENRSKIRQAIEIPSTFILPPISKELAHEDIRKLRVTTRIRRTLNKWFSPDSQGEQQ